MSLSAFAPEEFVSRNGFGSPVPRQPAHLHTRAESGAYLRNSSRVPRRCPSFTQNCHTPSGQSQVYRVAQLRTDGQSSTPLYCLRENISFDTLIRRSSRGHNSRKATQPSHCGTCLILLIFIAKRVQPSLPSSTLRSNFVYPRQISRSPRVGHCMS